MKPSRASGEQNVVHLLGSLAVQDSDGRDVGTVPAGRASLLLQRLAAASGTTLEVESIIEFLWPNQATDDRQTNCGIVGQPPS